MSETRRDFLKQLALFGIGTAVGSKITEPIQFTKETAKISWDKQKAIESLKRLFNVRNAIADNQEGSDSHTISSVDEPQKMVVLGEIGIEDLTNGNNILSPEEGSGVLAQGGEVMSSEKVSRRESQLSEYAIVIATDFHMITEEELRLVTIRLSKINPFFKEFFGSLPLIGYVGAEAMGRSRDQNGSETAEDSKLDRRGFLKFMVKAAAATGYSVLGRVGVKAIDSQVPDTAIMEFTSPVQEQYYQELVDIYNPAQNLLVKGRDNHINLNTRVASLLKLDEYVEGVQLTVAPGHTNTFNLLETPASELEQQSSSYLLNVIEQHIVHMKKHKNLIDDIQYQMDLIQSLMKGFGIYQPIRIRINKENTDANLENLYPNEKTVSEVITPFEIWCKTMSRLENDQRLSPKIKRVFEWAVSMMSTYIEVSGEAIETSNHIVGWPGDPESIDTSYSFFGYNASFSKGLPVSMVSY